MAVIRSFKVRLHHRNSFGKSVRPTAIESMYSASWLLSLPRSTGIRLIPVAFHIGTTSRVSCQKSKIDSFSTDMLLQVIVQLESF